MEADLGNHEEVQDKYMKETGHKSDATDAQFSSTTKENLDSLPEDEEKNDKNNENVDDGKKNDGKNNEEVVDEKKNDDNENDVDGGKKNDDNEGDVDDEKKKNDDKNNEDDVGDETKEIQLNLENEKLKQEISSLKKSIQFYKKNYANNDDCESLQEELESQKRHYEKIIKRKKNDYELKVQELNQKLFDADKELQNYKDYIESFKTEYKKIQEELDANKRDLNDLKTNNIALKEEASKYQSALGVATNFRTSDYKNHSVQLKNDILSLQDSIENYATNLKGKIEINFSNVEKLIQYYGCRTKITKEKPNRSFIKAILQRHVLDTVIEQARNYFNNSGSLESEILYETLHLCSKLNKLSGSRKGVDTITPTSSIKIRQEACVALSNRGFSEIIEKNQTIEHDFIERTKHILNDSMNEYRTIIDPAKKQPVENMATNIVREIIRIFWFRLRAQEPTISSVWINPHVKIDTNTMSGIWEKGEEDIDILFVDLCYFPVIGLNLNDSSKRKLYTRAKVFPIYQEQTYANVTSTLLERGRKIVKNVMPSKEDPAQQVNSNEDVHKQT